VILIGISSLFLIANVIPYYESSDSLVYGITVHDLAKGSYGFTNDLMQRFHGGPFIPNQWVGTVQDTAIPLANIGLPSIGTAFYFLFGDYALYYIGPVATILLLIFSERLTTKLFGSLAGLVTLIFLIQSEMIFFSGKLLNTDIIFSLLVIFGFFYLVKFLKDGNEKFILYSSVFFASSVLLRMNGVILFPVELILVGFFFIKTYYFRNSKKIDQQSTKFQTKNLQSNGVSIKNINVISNLISLKATKRIIKTLTILIIPWIFVILFLTSYNNYFFGDPFTNYSAEYTPEKKNINFFVSFFTFDSERFDWIKFYSMGLFTEDLKNYLKEIVQPTDRRFIDENWVSAIVYSMLFVPLAISLYFKRNRTEVITLLFIIFSMILFYSSDYVTLPYDDAKSMTRDVQDRYMIPSFVLFSMLLGFFVNWIFKSISKKNGFSRQNKSKLAGFVDSTKNPQHYLDRYNNEYIYKSWFDRNYPNLTIKQAVGLEAKRKFNVNWLSIFFLIPLFLVLFTLIDDSPSISYIEKIQKQNFKFFNPITSVDDQMEVYRNELPQDSIIITNQGKWGIFFYDGIPFHTESGWINGKWDPNRINDNDIIIIHVLMNEGKDLYSIKGKSAGEPYFFRYLEQEYGLILKSYSRNTCILEKIPLDESSETISDDICYGRGGYFVPKFQT